MCSDFCLRMFEVTILEIHTYDYFRLGKILLLASADYNFKFDFAHHNIRTQE